MPHTHLTQPERYCIQEFLVMGWPLAAIAEVLDRDRSTIWREVQRNRNHRDRYEGHHAQCLAEERRSVSRRNRRFTADDWECVRVCLKQDWSPEQVSIRFAALDLLRISHTTIYNYLHQERRQLHSLWPHLRQGHRQRRRRGGARPPSIRGPSIRHRPRRIDQRTEVGHWEIDTVYGADREQALVTAVERVSMRVAIGKLRAVRAEQLTDRVIWLLRRQPLPVLSLTMDNGPEMAGWRRLSAILQVPCYFTDPYSAWQRGSNENMNGLIRQYFPKGVSLHEVTQRDCDAVADLLNSRPRKGLGGFTPEECYGT
ncbi:MAG TPA: IS30 family transposase [Gemmatimonadales bacterium]|nr:IS30 family transposase [Gemmatimonadales bacterium]